MNVFSKSENKTRVALYLRATFIDSREPLSKAKSVETKQ